MKPQKKLTNLERRIMDILWEADMDLTVTEISKRSKNMNISVASVNQVIPRLIEKGFIEVKSFKMVSKKYARAFAPLISREDYASQELSSYFGTKSTENTFFGLKSMISALVNNQENKKDNEKLLQDLKNYAEEQLKKL